MVTNLTKTLGFSAILAGLLTSSISHAFDAKTTAGGATAAVAGVAAAAAASPLAKERTKKAATLIHQMELPVKAIPSTLERRVFRAPGLSNFVDSHVTDPDVQTHLNRLASTPGTFLTPKHARNLAARFAEQEGSKVRLTVTMFNRIVETGGSVSIKTTRMNHDFQSPREAAKFLEEVASTGKVLSIDSHITTETGATALVRDHENRKISVRNSMRESRAKALRASAGRIRAGGGVVGAIGLFAGSLLTVRGAMTDESEPVSNCGGSSGSVLCESLQQYADSSSQQRAETSSTPVRTD